MSAASCIDFVVPDLAEQGAPAVLFLEVRMVGVDTVTIGGTLAPGIDETGFIREVGARPLQVAGLSVQPVRIGEDGSLTYEERRPFDFGATVRVLAPELPDAGAQAPEVDWPTVQRADPDTVTLQPDGSLVVHPIIAQPALPQPDIVQWSLRVESEMSAVTITADGLPPDSIVIPAHLLPPNEGGPLQARLGFYQSVRVEPPPGDYVAIIVLDTRVFWTVETQ